MSAERIKPPQLERAFVFTFSDDESIELTARQYAEMSMHFMEVLCKDCEHKGVKDESS